jgi:endonuclease/exonuclease/phosphatase family metal-dependent hydrolase
MADRLRFITYNIRKGKGASGRDKMTEPLARAIAIQAPDVLLCQEVFHAHGSAAQSDLIAEALDMVSHYRANKHRKVGHHGNASFTKLPISTVQNFDVSTNPIERRGALYTRVELPHGPLHIFNVHLGLTERQRFTQVEQINELVKRLALPHDPVLIAGDFNDWNGRIDKHVTGQLGFTNAFALKPVREIRTWHAKRPVFNLDRVYLRHITIENASCLVGEPWNVLSDHLPLCVELNV